MTILSECCSNNFQGNSLRVETDRGFPMGEKEKLLRGITSQSVTHEQLKLQMEQVANGPGAFDFLEILSGDNLAYIARGISSVYPQGSPDDADKTTRGILRTQATKRFEQFLGGLSEHVNRFEWERAREFVTANRKCLSGAQSKSQILELCNLIVGISDHGLIPDIDELYLYPGSFNPFPHSGHRELARIGPGSSRQKNIRTVVWTLANNPGRPETNATFKERLEELRLGFFDEVDISVLGIEGDCSESRQYEQMKLIASIAGKREVRYLLGGEAFVTKLVAAAKGDDGVRQMMQDQNFKWCVSPRKEDDPRHIQDAAKLAEYSFGTRVEYLPGQLLNISGTEIRGMSLNMRRKYMNETQARDTIWRRNYEILNRLH